MEKYDASLLTRFLTELPNLSNAFEEACALAPDQRLTWAKQQRKNIFRDGWYINTPAGARGDGETVEAHVDHLKKLIKNYLPATLQDHATFIAEHHDDHETLAHAVIDGIKRDLNPLFNKTSYTISGDDKKTIEALARMVIFENYPDVKKSLDAYPHSCEESARLFSDLDKICVMWRCADFVESGKYQPLDFQAYWDYWTPENVSKKCTPLIAEIYRDDLWPRVERFEI